MTQQQTHLVETSRGLTLTSLMVAVALSGVLAVAGVRMVGTQMNTMRVMELRDKGDSIFRFYSNLLHDDKVWWCTLYDRILGQNPTPTNNPNRRLRYCVLQGENCTGGSTMRLMGPDCRFTEPVCQSYPCTNELLHRFGAFGQWRFLNPDPGTTPDLYANSTVTLIPVDGKDLKDSIVDSDSDGWWNVKVTWQHMGNSAVDIIFTQKFDAAKWQAEPATGKRHLPELDYPRTLRVRRSANQVYQPPSADMLNDPYYNYAVTGIALHTANRTAIRHTSKTVLTSHGFPYRGHLSLCHDSPWGFKKYGPLVGGVRPLLADWGVLKGGVVQSTAFCSALDSGRVAVTPTDCGAQYSVIDRIGKGAGVTAANNVRCALDGRGKMVLYNQNCSRIQHRDSCTVTGGNPATQTFTSSSYVPGAIAYITGSGGQRCTGLARWPATRQGLRGRRGPAGSGPRGPPGPAWNRTCQ